MVLINGENAVIINKAVIMFHQEHNQTEAVVEEEVEDGNHIQLLKVVDRQIHCKAVNILETIIFKIHSNLIPIIPIQAFVPQGLRIMLMI